MNVIQQSWQDHCKHLYPRELAVKRYDGNGLYRLNQDIGRLIYNASDLIKQVKYYQSKDTPCYITVYPFDELKPQDYTTARINTLFFDFDSEEKIELALEDALKFKTYYIESRVYFSGGKGFACYLDFPTASIQPELKKEALSALQRNIAAALELKTSDTSVYGDLARVSRLPNTIHHKQWRRWPQYCMPVEVEDLLCARREGIDYIRMLARAPRDFKIKIEPIAELKDTLEELSKNVSTAQERRVIEQQLAAFKRRLEPPRARSNGICPGITSLMLQAVKKQAGAESRWYGGCALIRANQMWLNKTKEETDILHGLKPVGS